MDPEIVERPHLLIVGIMDCGAGVKDIDIHRIWSIYEQFEDTIENRIPDTWYELHVGSDMGCGIYSVTAGVGVTSVANLSSGLTMKGVPAGSYAHFAHQMKNGGFARAFEPVEEWISNSGANALDFGLQVFDRNFSPDDGESVLHIYIPLA